MNKVPKWTLINSNKSNHAHIDNYSPNNHQTHGNYCIECGYMLSWDGNMYYCVNKNCKVNKDLVTNDF